MENEKKKKKTFWSVFFKRIKITHILLLIVLLAANSYAWFIYVNTISNEVDVHVKAWRIDFTDENTPVTDYVDVVVDSVYPGMTPYAKEIDAHNYSDLGATVSFEILSVSIMGDEYITEEGKLDLGLQLDGDEPTTSELQTMLNTDYPFKITFNISSNSISAGNGVSTYTIGINWPYESGDDELDTYWGTKAYEFKEDNPDDPCIELKVKIIITQDEE